MTKRVVLSADGEDSGGDFECEDTVMAPSEMRFALLVRLAWELRAVPVSCWLVLRGDGEPVLFVRDEDGDRRAVLVGECHGSWRVMWCGEELGTAQLDVTARTIAKGLAA